MEQELLAWVGTQIVTWGGIAGGLSAIIAFAVKIIKPMRSRRQQERNELAEYRQGVKESIAALTSKIDELS